MAVAVDVDAGLGAVLDRDRGSGLDVDVARLRAGAAAVIAHDVAAVDVPEAVRVHRQVRATCDQLLAFAARLLTRVEEDGRWAATGARTFPEWVSGQSGASVGAARREVALGKALDTDLPVTTAAVTAGRMTLEHAQVLARFAPTSEARRAALASDLPDRNEAHLVGEAARMGVDEFGRQVRRWAARVDTDTHEGEYRAIAARERLVLLRRDGGVGVDGFLTVEHGDVLATALRAVTGVPAATDTRTPDQRRAGALTDLARLVLDTALGGSGRGQVRPHITVHVPWDTFRQLGRDTARADGGSATGAGAAFGLGSLTEPAELDDGEPIPPSVLARIACDSAITRVVFGPQGQPLDVGHTQRTFTGAMRHAVVARDRACRYPGCTAPPVLGEVHHVAWWARDRGPTSVSNGILVCWHHHDLIHQSNLAVTRTPDGTWQFRRTDGTPIGAPGDSSAQNAT